MTGLIYSFSLAVILAAAPWESAIAQAAAKKSPTATANAAAAESQMFGWQKAPQEARKAPAASPDIASRTQEATVLTTVEVPGFNTVYLELESSGKKFWIASRLTSVRVGGRVRFSPENVVAMENFESKALHRTFDKIYFVPTIVVTDGS